MRRSRGTGLRGMGVGLAALALVAACDGSGSAPTTLELFSPDFAPVSIAAPDCEYGGLVKRISADNRLTVRFELCRPDVTLGSKVASPAFGVLPTEVLEAARDDPTVLDAPVGSGPYRLGEWSPGEELVLERFDGYRDEPAETERLVFRWDPDPHRRLAQLRQGAVDGIDDPPPEEYDAIESDPSLQLLPRTGTNLSYLGLNTDVEPLTDSRVRQAIALALDRAAIIEEAYPPPSSVAEQVLPPSLAAWTPTPLWPESDPAAAAALLTGRGGDPIEITLTHPAQGTPALPDPGAVAAAVRDQLAAVGITVAAHALPAAELSAALAAGEPAMFLDVWEATTPDVASFFDEMFIEEPARFGSDLAAIEAAIVGARLGNADMRYVSNEFVADAIIETVPLVPLGTVDSATAFAGDVEDVRLIRFGLDEFEPTASPVRAEQFASTDPGGRDTMVWMQAAEPAGLFCADEVDPDTLRACAQILDTLLRFETGDAEVTNSITETWTANDDATVWTFRLLDGIEFHDGSHLDAGDVVRTFEVHWDAAHPLHRGDFEAFRSRFGGFLNDGGAS